MKIKSAREISRKWGVVTGLALAAALPLQLAVADSSAKSPPPNATVAKQPGGFEYFVGIVGNPSVLDIRWSDEQLEQIKAPGVNMVQLSIAWGGKPANEALNLEDLNRGASKANSYQYPERGHCSPIEHIITGGTYR